MARARAMTRLLADKALGLSIVLALLAFAADRIHKFVQIEMLGWTGHEFVRVTPFFDYTLVWNTGISYGLLDGMPIWALLAMMCAAIALLFWWWTRAETALIRCGLAICLGGAASHVIDRWIYGAVPDFFHFHWRAWSFYVFNISDTVITIGVVLLLVDMVWSRKGKHAQSH